MSGTQQWAITAEPPVSGFIVDETVTMRGVLRASVDATGSGATEVVAAVPGFRIRVLALLVVVGSAVTVRFKSGTTAISAGYPFEANGGMAPPINPHGWFQTAVGEALNIDLSLAAVVGCDVTYCLVP